MVDESHELKLIYWTKKFEWKQRIIFYFAFQTKLRFDGFTWASVPPPTTFINFLFFSKKNKNNDYVYVWRSDNIVRN